MLAQLLFLKFNYMQPLHMAYNKNNYFKRLRYIIQIYNQYKNEDVPDTKIVHKIMPNHGINISYRQWMNIKGKAVPKEL